ncbi:MAG: hypothetical protein JST59_01245 [Actinobacteria bacterium]|nr:hypothetical protein [Actinomycetota bacterium]
MSDDYNRNIAGLKEQLEKNDTEHKLGCEDLSKKLALREGEIGSQLRLNNELKMEVGQLVSELNQTKQELAYAAEFNRKHAATLREFEQSKQELDRLK